MESNPKIVRVDPYTEEDFIKITDSGNIEIFHLTPSEIIEIFRDCLTEEQIKLLENNGK